MRVFRGGGLRTHRRSRMPALWIRVLPAQRRVVSRSRGTPSDWLGLTASWSGVASGFERSETIAARVARREVEGEVDVQMRDKRVPLE